MNQVATNQERKDQQRRKILAAATKLFLRDGYKPTHVKGVADEANVSQVTLYKYFDSKYDLAHQVVLDLIVGGYAQYRTVVDDPQKSFREVVQFMMKTKVKVSAGMSQDFYNFTVADMQGKFGNGEAKATYDAGKQSFWDAVIQRGRDAGMINPEISNAALTMYLDMYVDYFSSPDHDIPEYRQLIDQLMHLFFYGFVGLAPDTVEGKTSKERKHDGK